MFAYLIPFFSLFLYPFVTAAFYSLAPYSSKMQESSEYLLSLNLDGYSFELC